MAVAARRRRYVFRLKHAAADPDAPGCALLWEVYGGSEVYQIAAERLGDGGLAWSCTCPDHAYRVEDSPGERPCKHVRRLLAAGRRAV